MNVGIPGNISFRHLFNLLFIGSLLNLIIIFFINNLLNINLLNVLLANTGTWIFTFIFLSFSFMAGISSTWILAIFIKYLYNDDNKKYKKCIFYMHFILLYKKETRNDIRLTLLPKATTLNYQIKSLINEQFSTDFDAISTIEKKHLFYIINRFIENKCSDKSLEMIGWYNFLANFFARLSMISILSTYLSIISIIIKITLNKGTYNIYILLSTAIFSYLASQWFALNVPKQLTNNHKNIIRLYFAYQSEK